MRRWAFGQMYVLNATAPYAVKGMWLLRGQDIKPMLDSNPDAEYYTWCVPSACRLAAAAAAHAVACAAVVCLAGALLHHRRCRPMLDRFPSLTSVIVAFTSVSCRTKMDPSKEEDRKVVDAFWAEPAPEEKLFDAVVYDSRVFK